MNVYALKNTKAGFWNPPTFSDAPRDAIAKNLFRYCRMNQAEARKAHYDECELYIIGTFDDERGNLTLFDEKSFLIDLSGAFDHE